MECPRTGALFAHRLKRFPHKGSPHFAASIWKRFPPRMGNGIIATKTRGGTARTSRSMAECGSLGRRSQAVNPVFVAAGNREWFIALMPAETFALVSVGGLGGRSGNE